MKTIDNVKNDFPIFKNNPNLIYLDNGATSHKPQEMIDSISHYYSHDNSNIGRGVYKLAEKSQKLFDNARKNIAHFINSPSKDIVFTSSCTESLNLASYIVGQNLKKGDKIVLSISEHHANILPWQRIAKEKQVEIIFIKNIDILLNPENLPENFWKDVKVISFTHISNVTGLITPIEKWINEAKKHNVITIIDAAQSICSKILNIEELQCDFLAFSSHKIFGPMGVGVLYVNPNYLQNKNLIIEPLLLGGGIIEDVIEDTYFLIEDNLKFEAGTPNVADVIGLSSTFDYLNKKNWKELLLYTHQLGIYLYEKIKNEPDLYLVIDKLLENDTDYKHPYENLINKHLSPHIISFYIKDIHPHDIGSYLATKNIAVRVGKHCTHPLHEYIKLNSSIRVSLAFYNTKEDIDILIKELKECIKFFRSN